MKDWSLKPVDPMTELEQVFFAAVIAARAEVQTLINQEYPNQ